MQLSLELRPQGGDLLQIKGPRMRSELSSALYFRNIPPPLPPNMWALQIIEHNSNIIISLTIGEAHKAIGTT